MQRLAFVLLLFLPWFAQAQDTESLGHFRFYDLFLSPELHLQEPGNGGFEIKNSWIGFEWKRDNFVTGILKLGSSDLMRSPIWFSPQAKPDFTVVEAWIEGRSDVGDVRAGLLSIPQGFEGTFPEWNSVLPESRVHREGWVVQRDYGLQFRWDTKPWATSVTVHNGEAGANTDRWMWLSSNWQYKNDEGFGLLLSATFGNTRPDSTATSVAATDALFRFDPSKDARIRYAILSLFREERRSLFLIEAARGDIVQNDFPGDEKRPFGWGRSDICWNFGGDVSLLLRYEATQADMKNRDTLKSSTGLGLVVASADNLQSLTLYGQHNQEGINESPNDEFWLIFRLHSNLLK